MRRNIQSIFIKPYLFYLVGMCGTLIQTGNFYYILLIIFKTFGLDLIPNSSYTHTYLTMAQVPL